MIKGCHNLYKNKTTFYKCFSPQPQHEVKSNAAARYDETRVIRIQSNEVVDGGFVAHQIDLFQDSLGRLTSVAKIVRKKKHYKGLNYLISRYSQMIL